MKIVTIIVAIIAVLYLIKYAVKRWLGNFPFKAIIIFALFAIDLKGQDRVCKTDSAKWIIDNVFYKGDSSCSHSIVYSKEENTNYGCLVMHGEGCNCYLQYKFKMGICRLCKYHFKERYFEYQSDHEKPISEYEKIIKSIPDTLLLKTN